ncbi:MAG: hypothetical protein EOP47_28280, partial [Sphingobacteriaceae bacterium]
MSKIENLFKTCFIIETILAILLLAGFFYVRQGFTESDVSFLLIPVAFIITSFIVGVKIMLATGKMIKCSETLIITGHIFNVMRLLITICILLLIVY